MLASHVRPGRFKESVDYVMSRGDVHIKACMERLSTAPAEDPVHSCYGQKHQSRWDIRDFRAFSCGHASKQLPHRCSA